MSKLCYPGSSKQFCITAEQMSVYKSTLSSMMGKRMNCIAMLNLTQETIYKVSLITFNEAIKKLKKVISRGTGSYSKDSATYRFVAEYEAAKERYDFAVLQMTIKMHPSQSAVIMEKMQNKTSMALEKENISSAALRANDVTDAADITKVIISDEIYV